MLLNKLTVCAVRFNSFSQSFGKWRFFFFTEPIWLRNVKIDLNETSYDAIHQRLFSMEGEKFIVNWMGINLLTISIYRIFRCICSVSSTIGIFQFNWKSWHSFDVINTWAGISRQQTATQVSHSFMISKDTFSSIRLLLLLFRTKSAISLLWFIHNIWNVTPNNSSAIIPRIIK